uniref:Uncharacterized protein n=1 Tax=Moniliophthora roreri TaxID=221103 RepID=A0A0W0FQF2_MONRR
MLIRLWGSAEERKRELLRNFMVLVQAIEIASLRQITQTDIAEYEQLIGIYLHGLLDLFKGASVHSTHHALLHVGEFMEEMGPNHCRNASAQERYILFMQEQNVNMKFGELESTQMHSCNETANLYGLMDSDKDLRATVPNQVKSLCAITSKDDRGTKKANLIDCNNTAALGAAELRFIPNSEMAEIELIVQNRFKGIKELVRIDIQSYFLKQMAIRGVTYTIRS